MSEPIPLRNQGGLLAFDLAGDTGWCYAPPDYTSPAFITPDPRYQMLVSGAVRFGKPGDEAGARFLAAHHTFIRLIAIYRPRYIAMERPFFHPKHPSGSTMGAGYAAILRMHAAHHAVSVIDVTPREVKTFWTGNGNAKKPLMMDFARQRGLNPKTDDEADAIAVCDWAVATLNAAAAWPPTTVANQRVGETA